MADKIVQTSESMLACVSAYTSALSTLQDCVREFQNAINALENDYTGAAFAIMLVKVLDLIAKITKSFDRVQDAIKELGQVRELFEENEQKQQAMYANLDTGTKSPFVG